MITAGCASFAKTPCAAGREALRGAFVMTLETTGAAPELLAARHLLWAGAELMLFRSR